MRRVRYALAMSLDGYIAGPKGEADWIAMDPEIDFTALFSQFDTILVGRRTFDGMVASGRASMPGMKTIVFSRTLRQKDHPGIMIVKDGQRETLVALKASPGKDIWLFGGGSLFRSLAEDGLVDTVEVSIVPILLGAGVPLLPSPANRIKLSLTAHRVYPTGIVSLEYAIVRRP
ncbi:MAG: dihydrofolate reductase family protein [Bryobacteraceae bacterium]|jgi:dihydrofolate reductase